MEHSLGRQITGSGQNLFFLLHNIEPQHGRLSTRRADQSQQCSDRRGLSGAVGPDKAEEFSFFDCQADLLDAPGLSIMFRQILCLDCFHNFLRFYAVLLIYLFRFMIYCFRR